jgi:protocatechuate 3,4-dioxygenase beta subunit
MDRIESPSDFSATDPTEVALTRRRLLQAAGLLVVGSGASLAFNPLARAATKAGSCVVIPRETAGPFPGDGSNGVNVLTQKGVVRRDIRSSFGSSTTVRPGVPLSVTFQVRSVKNGCKPLVGAAFYAWHCDRDGNYSLYSPGVEDENFMRGVQVTDKQGNVTFTTIVPGAYPGRWPHIHFEVYPSLAKTSSSRNVIATSQLGFPKAGLLEAYKADGYAASLAEVEGTDISEDGIFRDGASRQTSTMTGSISAGYKSSLVVNV